MERSRRQRLSRVKLNGEIDHRCVFPGYQDGWNVGNREQTDSGNPFSDAHTTRTPTSSCKGKRARETATPHEFEKRGFKAGWSRAWESIHKAGWTEGCMQLSQHLLRRNVLPQMNGVEVAGEFHRVGAQSATFV